ncbi:hypothetical protein ACTQZS_08265 [Bilifractor sp. LCP19S3_H10]|uniref:hypothetical protein n=1 Tax=Bilifractor sp. LCP19S3_H10 TaxID=3438736 RepID=UPI003F903F03
MSKQEYYEYLVKSHIFKFILMGILAIETPILFWGCSNNDKYMLYGLIAGILDYIALNMVSHQIEDSGYPELKKMFRVPVVIILILIGIVLVPAILAAALLSVAFGAIGMLGGSFSAFEVFTVFFFAHHS